MNDKSLKISESTDIMLDGIAEHEECSKKYVVKRLVSKEFTKMPDYIKQNYSPINLESDYISSPNLGCAMRQSQKLKNERETSA